MRYFWDVYNYGYTSGNSAPLNGISGEECVFCTSATREIDQANAQGLRQTGGRITPQVIQAAPGPVGSSVVVISVVNQEASQVLDENASVVATSKALKAINADSRIEWTGKSWRMAAVTISSKGD